MRARHALLAALIVAGAARGEGPAPTPADAPEAKGALAWIGSDRLDLAGVLAARVPLATAGPWSALLDVDAVTAIRKAQSLTFLVDTVGYRLALLGRRSLGASGGVVFGAAERGIEAVDAPGSARVRTLEAAWESPGFRRAFGPEGLAGRVGAGAIVGRSGIDASASAFGEIRYLRRAGRVLVGGGAEVDALIGEDGGTDAAIGPRLELDLGGFRRAGFSVSWLHGGNPMGLGTGGLVAGFDLAQGAHAAPDRPVPPEVAGLVAGGGGDAGRATARLLVRVATPGFAGGTAVVAEVDGNVLTAQEGNDLYYLYHVGVTHPVGRFRAGGFFYHRSNHRIDRANPTVASIDVLEAGIETAGYLSASPGLDLGRGGGLDLRVRAGWLADSSFGERERWHARAGARWSSPGERLGGLHPYLGAAVERGDVGGSAYAAGVLLPRGWDVRIEKRHDEQLFALDRRLLLGVATLYF